MPKTRVIPRFLRRAGAFAVLPLLGGCVERTVTIVSDPPGALCWLNDVEVGRTPVKVPFQWYGDYDVKLRLDREEGTPEHPKTVHYYLHTDRRAHAPAYEWVGPDLVAETVPVDLKDKKVWAFNIPPAQDEPDEQLVANAKQLESQLSPVSPSDKKSK